MRVMARNLALCAAACAGAPAFAGATLDASLGKMGSGHPGEERNAAYAACILYGRDQTRLIAGFDKAGWERQEQEDEGSWSYNPPGQAETLWVMLYADHPSCSVVDLTTGTGVAGALVGEMLAADAFTVTPGAPGAEGECGKDRVTSTLPGSPLTLQVISGEDYSDCNSDSASVVIIDLEE